MSVLFVQTSTSVGSMAGTNTATPAMAAGATVNNLLILPYAHLQFDAGTQTETAPGFTAANSIIGPSNAPLAGCLYKVAAGGETNATLTNTTSGTAANSFGDVVLAEFSGLANVSPYVSADSNTASGAAVTSLSVSSSNPLSQTSGLAVVCYADAQSLAGHTWPTAGGWISLDNDANANGCLIEYLIFSSNAQLTASLETLNTAGNIAATITIFKAAIVVATAIAAGQLFVLP